MAECQGDIWRTQRFRQMIRAKIESAIQHSKNPTKKSVAEIENHAFQKAKSKDEYIQFVARHIIKFQEMVASSNRVLSVISNMKTILSEGKRADMTIKLGNRKWPVHKIILESRCEYFRNMFRHDEWSDNTVSEVEFKDMEEHALGAVLDFIYTGSVENMSVTNVCDIYVAARRFLLDDLRTLCIQWMMEHMSMDIFCKVLIIADTYKEDQLKERVIDFFKQGAGKILELEEWKKIKNNHASIVADLLEEAVKREVKRQRKE